MIPRAKSPIVPAAVTNMLASPRFAAALTHGALGFAFSTHLVLRVMGWPGLLGALVTLVFLASLSLIARRTRIEWYGLLPISILIFVGWCALSSAWSNYPGYTVAGVGYQLAFAVLAFYIALVRDTIQIVRATGDVLRVLLGASLAVEVLSGLLLDLPIAFLGVQGNIARLGPIQGLFESRNVLGLVSLLAGVTFLVEVRARSVQRWTGIGSICLAGISLALTRSPVSLIVAVAVGVAALALYRLRRTPREQRLILQLGLLGASLVAGILAWAARTPIEQLLSGRTEFEVRNSLWHEVWHLVDLHPLEGWGWVGLWPKTIAPFGWLDFVTRNVQTTGLNAYLDVYFQVGLIGFVAFLALIGLAFMRSWLLASNKRTFVHVWPALILVVLLATSAAESTVLVDFGWVLLLVCSVKAAQGMSWRSGLPRSPRVDVN